MKVGARMILWMALAAFAGSAGRGWAQDQQHNPIGYVNILKMRSESNVYKQARDELSRLQDEKQRELQLAQQYRFLTGQEAIDAVSLELKPKRTDGENELLTKRKTTNTDRELRQTRLSQSSQPSEAESTEFKQLQQIAEQRKQELAGLQQSLQTELDDRERAWDEVVTGNVTAAFEQVAREQGLWVILSYHIRTLLPDFSQPNMYIPEFQNVVLWGGVDVTDRVVEVLNDMSVTPPPAAPAGPTAPPPAPAPQ